MAHGTSRFSPLACWHRLPLAVPSSLGSVAAAHLKARLARATYWAETDFLGAGGRQSDRSTSCRDRQLAFDGTPAGCPAWRTSPPMIAALQALPSGLPDLHIGGVSSNMGAGDGAMGGNAAKWAGRQGPLVGQRSQRYDCFGCGRADPYATDPNTLLIATGCGLMLVNVGIEDIQDPTVRWRIRNYSTANNLQLADVFSCLATAVGTKGCGEEHQLQADPRGPHPQPSINEANTGFISSDAYLRHRSHY